MIKVYHFNYDFHQASATFEVDTEKFTADMAQVTLDFFTWNYDKEKDPVDEVMNKYAIQVLECATFNRYNVKGVIDSFNNNEGFCRLDGSAGITLIEVSPYEIDEQYLAVRIEDKVEPK